MTSTGDIELRSVVKFCVGLAKSPVETLKLITSSKTLPNCSKTFVYRWHERYRNERKSIEDDNRTGQPSIVTISSKERVKELRHSHRAL